MPRGVGGYHLASFSGSQQLLDQIARYGVKEEAQQEEQKTQAKCFQDQPAVVVPQEVSERLHRVHEPDKADVWASIM